MAPSIIGIGTPHRGDDEAGLLAARHLGAPEHSGDGLALLDLWAGAEEVILIDAVAGGGAPGDILEFDGRDAPLDAAGLRGSTHTFGVAEAIEMARALGRLPARLTIYAIVGSRFDQGAKASPEVAAAALRLAGELARLTGQSPSPSASARAPGAQTEPRV